MVARNSERSVGVQTLARRCFPRVRKLLAVPIALTAILWCGAVGAADQRFGDEDVALLPAYCKDTQSFAPYYGSPGGYEARMRQIGPTFHHLHHYCLALVYINQAAVSKSELRTS